MFPFYFQLTSKMRSHRLAYVNYECDMSVYSAKRRTWVMDLKIFLFYFMWSVFFNTKCSLKINSKNIFTNNFFRRDTRKEKLLYKIHSLLINKWKVLWGNLKTFKKKNSSLYFFNGVKLSFRLREENLTFFIKDS